MEMLSLKLGKAINQKHKLLEMIEKSNVQNNLGKIESKEQNLKNIEKINEAQQSQEQQISQFRDQVKEVGQFIQEGISQDKLKEIEDREKDKENLRNQKEKEMVDYLNSQQNEKKAKQLELNNQQDEISRQSIALQSLTEEVEKLIKSQQQALTYKDKDFTDTMNEKEKLLAQLMQQLGDLKQKIKDEKKKCDNIQEAEEDLECEKQRMVGELERLDQEIDNIEMENELNNQDDQDFLIEKLQQDEKDLQNLIGMIDQEIAQNNIKLDDIKKSNQLINNDVNELDQEIDELEDQDFDLDQLQQSLQDEMDEQKQLFESNLQLMQKLKDVEMNSQESGKKNIELEQYINLLTDQNFAERKSRAVEKLLQELEDILREKRRGCTDIKRKVIRISEMIGDTEYMKGFGIEGFQEKLERFDIDILEFEKDKEQIRQKKKKIDAMIVGKQANEINDELIKKTLQSLQDIEKEVDNCIVKENDILIIDRLKKQFHDTERDIGTDFFKKAKLLKESQEKRQELIIKKADAIQQKAKQIEEEVLPDVTKIADDEDEKEILKNKIDILKDIKRSASDLILMDIEQNTQVKLQKIVFQRDNTYDTIEQYQVIQDIELEINCIDKDINQIEKRLLDFEQGLKQFEVELKVDFYEDSLQEVKEQKAKLQKLENQINQLNDGIKDIEEAIQQAQSGNNIMQSQDDILQLQQMADKLKEQRNLLEKQKKELAKDGAILQGDLNEVNIEMITPTTLEKFDNEIVRLRDITNAQEKLVNDALNEMKKVKENAQAIAFKKKADKRQECKQKLKMIKDNTDEFERILSEIGSTLDMICKDAEYLKESEWSPVKGRPSLIYGQNGDLEKEKEVIKQFKEQETQQKVYETLVKEKDQLKKLIALYQKQYDNFPLEESHLIDYEGLYDAFQADLDEKSQSLKEQGKDLLENQLKQLKENIENLIEKFKQKRAVLGDCRKEEKEKNAEIQKVESQINGFKLKLGAMERELLNSQNINFKANSEKKELSLNLLVEVQSLKNQITTSHSDGIQKQKQQLQTIVADLDLMGDKIVTLENLKQIYKQLLELKKDKGLTKEDLRKLGELINQKETQVEQLIKDMVRGSLYECERKLKEVDSQIDKLQKKLIELNNGMNDFEIDIKKGLQNNIGDKNEDLTKDGKRLSEENFQDRKELKSLEDQKNLIRKVLQKIKNSLNEQNEFKNQNIPNKTGMSNELQNEISPQTIEEFIQEIETCNKKGEVHSKDLQKLEKKLDQRKEEWGKCMFKNGAKDALAEDIERYLKDNIKDLNALEQKVDDMNKLLKGFDQVFNSMLNNPDYEQRQGYIKKTNELNLESQKQKDIIEKNKNQLKDQIQKQKDIKDKIGLKNLPLEEMQNLAKSCEETIEQISTLNKEADKVIKDLNKRRQKLGDADILDNFRMRVDRLNELDNKLKDLEKDSKELQKVIQESGKINPVGQQEAQQQFKQLSTDIGKQIKNKELISKRLVDLREKMKNKDLNRDDPSTFPPLIQEIREIKIQIQNIDQDGDKIVQNMLFMRNKYGEIDIEKKIDQFILSANDQRKKLDQILDDVELLKDLYEEFDGYTSDTQEEDFIERLGSDLKELATKHSIALEESEQISDQIIAAQKNLNRRKNAKTENPNTEQMGSKELEERAQLISKLEEQSLHCKKFVDELQSKTNKNKKVFMSMQSKEKLRRRQQEVIELSNRLEQYENHLNDIEADMQSEANNIKIAAEGGEKLMEIFEELFQQIDQIKQDYAQNEQNLQEIDQDINDFKDPKFHQFDLLKGNIQVKKRILNSIAQIKQVRQLFAQIKQKYEANKPQKLIAYRAAKGDYVDQLLADWLNNNQCPVPIKRLGAGYYMFGTKKIYAKIINGKLVIRVGGGYMSIDEFMFYYGAQELNKMIAYENVEDNEEIDLDQALDGERNQGDLIKHSNEGKSVIGIQQMKKRLSPRIASPRVPSPNQQNLLKKSAQGVSPRGGIAIPKNLQQIHQKNESFDAGKLGIPGKKSPDQSSFLKRTVQKKIQNDQSQNDESSKIEMIIREKDKGQQ